MIGPAGIAEPEQFGHLVERLAGGIVAGLPEQAIANPIAHFEKVGVSAAHHQRESGVFHRRRPRGRLP